jgi:hypothetical protein
MTIFANLNTLGFVWIVIFLTYVPIYQISQWWLTPQPTLESNLRHSMSLLKYNRNEQDPECSYIGQNKAKSPIGHFTRRNTFVSGIS